jgi:hypothetical protein
MPEVTATMAAVATKVTTTVASSVSAVAPSVSAVASSVTTTAVAAMPSRLGRHIGCGHHHTGGSGSREAINSGQGPKGQ